MLKALSLAQQWLDQVAMTKSVEASHNKVYMVVADATADGSNEATITIEPPLITALTNDSVVTYDNVPFTVHLVNDIQEFGTVGADKDGNLLYQFELDVEETL